MAYAGETPEHAATRIARQRTRTRGGIPPGDRREEPGDAKFAALARARGEDIQTIAKMLEFSYDRARRLLGRADVVAMLTKFRELHRVQTVERAADMTPRLFRRMERAVEDEMDPEAVAKVKDLTTSVLNMERTAASASGETKAGPTTIQVANILAQQQGPADPKAQLAELLDTLEAQAG
jgi:hypothetical protein